MSQAIDRRRFLAAAGVSTFTLAGLGGPLSAFGAPATDSKKKEPLYKISLAQWSLHKELGAKKMTNLDFPKVAKKELGIDALEYVNVFFFDKAKDKDYLKELKQRCDDLEVSSLLIMCDREGDLGDADETKRAKAIENHYKWVEAAKYLGCHSIRVNARSKGTYEEQRDRSVDGLTRLGKFAEDHKINVIVENHGGLSSDGKWLKEVMKKCDRKNVGTLPDFGNFYEYDRYQGVKDLMPYAKGVSAKSYDFDSEGNETKIDYEKMLKIVLDAGYHGYVGIEYEGKKTPEKEGIRKTKELLERVREKLEIDASKKKAA